MGGKRDRREAGNSAQSRTPHPGGEAALLDPDRVNVNGRRDRGGVAHPALKLNDVSGHAAAAGRADAQAAAQSPRCKPWVR